MGGESVCWNLLETQLKETLRDPAHANPGFRNEESESWEIKKLFAEGLIDAVVVQV